jgi:hypothetical protein
METFEFCGEHPAAEPGHYCGACLTVALGKLRCADCLGSVEL